MSCADVLETWLGRELSTEEREFLQFLTPQGVSKANADLIGGVRHRAAQAARGKRDFLRHMQGFSFLRL